MTKLFIDYGADVNARSPKDWTPLSYAQAKGKYGATEEKVESVSLYTHYMGSALMNQTNENIQDTETACMPYSDIRQISRDLFLSCPASVTIGRRFFLGHLSRGRPPALWRQGLWGGRPACAGHPQPEEQLQPRGQRLPPREGILSEAHTRALRS